MAIEFPKALLRAKSYAWNLVGTSVTSGDTANASVMVRSDGGGFWTCTMNDVSLSGLSDRDFAKQRQRRATLLWRAIRQQCNGGINPIIVPRCDALFRPWYSEVSSGAPPQTGDIVPFSDNATFSDGSTFFQSSGQIIIVAAAAELRATSLFINVIFGGVLMGGESFSIEHPTKGWRLYEIASVFRFDATHYQIFFNPPLREALTGETRLEFEQPRCLMRLTTPSSMDLTVVPWTFNSASVDFIETP